jgi:formate dehydrogenase/NADH-quinone oxidoreductase subunit F
VPCRVGSHKAHALLSDLVDQGKGVDDVPDEITQLEETLRLTSICGLGQVALGPVLSVLGIDRGGAAAREHPKDRADTET